VGSVLLDRPTIGLQVHSLRLRVDVELIWFSRERDKLLVIEYDKRVHGARVHMVFVILYQ
jgi:hypothetical protein